MTSLKDAVGYSRMFTNWPMGACVPAGDAVLVITLRVVSSGVGFAFFMALAVIGLDGIGVR